MFAKLLGHSQIEFSATAEVLWGIKKLNLALVLDNTGSMSSSGKMTDAEDRRAQPARPRSRTPTKQPGDIKVAIVPFATDVNVGTSNVNATWIDWTDWDAANGNCSNNNYTPRAVASDTARPGRRRTTAPGTAASYDRDQNNDVTNTATGRGQPPTMFRAHQASNCPTAMMPLSTDWTALNAKIDAMTPTGNTNVTIGLPGAWQTLSPVAPFNAPAPAHRSRQGHHPADRRREHPEPLDARAHSAIDARTAEGLRQRQGRQHQALYGARDRRQRARC